MKGLDFANCLRILFFWGFLIVGLAMTAESQEMEGQISEQNEENHIGSSSENNYEGLHEGMLMINGRASWRYVEDEYTGNRGSEIVLAPRISYFASRAWAMGILFQFERRFDGVKSYNYFGIGPMESFYVNLGNGRSYLNFDFAFAFLWGGDSDDNGGDIRFNHGVGFAQFITNEVAIDTGFDFIYRPQDEASHYEIRFRGGLSYFLDFGKGY